MEKIVEIDKIQMVTDYYCAELQKSAVAKKYLASRKITEESIQCFKVGYAPSYSKYVPRFHDRIIFPIWNASGKLVGWTGRTIINDPAKYVNVKESGIFQKGRILYGFNFMKSSIFKYRKAILVEGQLDVITLYQFGIPFAVATSGTSIQEAAMSILARYADTVYIIFDADDAGNIARGKAQKYLEDRRVQVKHITLPVQEDPDSYINKVGKDNFLNILKEA